MTTEIGGRPATAGERAGAPARRYLIGGARVLLGLIFLVTGFNGFLNFLPAPTTMPQGALGFSLALAKTGYMVPLVSGTQVVVGALFVSNRFVPLGLAIAAPLIVNILAFHAFLMPALAAPGVLVAILEVFLAWRYRRAYGPMLAARADPA
jgi:uncharacterized membrane protein YphA (DoxX/SURF4 family)